MRFAQLEHADVAVWGYGREGRSVLAALQRHLPGKPLTLYCTPTEAARLRQSEKPSPSSGERQHCAEKPSPSSAERQHCAEKPSPSRGRSGAFASHGSRAAERPHRDVRTGLASAGTCEGLGGDGFASGANTASQLPRAAERPHTDVRTGLASAGTRKGLGDDGFPRGLHVRTKPPDADALASHDIVIKSPGISAYKPEILAARERGTRFTSGTALWFGENPDARVVAVTGTKGKSTTTSLIAHLARSLGVRTALAGNIGLPLLDLDGQRADLWAVELSSFQTGEAGPLELGVVVSLGEDHLDWHGSRERYVADKLKLADVSRTLLVDAGNALLMDRTGHHAHRIAFGTPDGWHVADGAIRRAGERVFEVAALPLHGAHNAHNACAALAAIEQLGLDARAAAAALAAFQPLPHRLTSLGTRDGIEWIDDSISTTPDAALAALESLSGRAVTLVLGGHDRGLDWTGFADALAGAPPRAVITQGASGARVARVLRESGVACELVLADDLAAAVSHARALTSPGGVVVLSPGAPSFDQFRDYAERGRAFARLAGFEGEAPGEIRGLGIA